MNGSDGWGRRLHRTAQLGGRRVATFDKAFREVWSVLRGGVRSVRMMTAARIPTQVDGITSRDTLRELIHDALYVGTEVRHCEGKGGLRE